jgi:hypothetical protein
LDRWRKTRWITIGIATAASAARNPIWTKDMAGEILNPKHEIRNKHEA